MAIVIFPDDGSDSDPNDSIIWSSCWSLFWSEDDYDSGPDDGQCFGPDDGHELVPDYSHFIRILMISMILILIMAVLVPGNGHDYGR